MPASPVPASPVPAPPAEGSSLFEGVVRLGGSAVTTEDNDTRVGEYLPLRDVAKVGTEFWGDRNGFRFDVSAYNGGTARDQDYRADFGPFAPGFRHFDFGDIAGLAEAINDNTCAVLIEPIQGEGGYVVPPDGFLRTGDAGSVDAEGHIYFVERIKELMKTSYGQYVAPQLVEGTLGKDPFIEQIAVVADARHFVSALIVPSFESLEEYARSINIQYQCQADLLRHSAVVAFFEARIQAMQQELARFQQVKKFTLLPRAFSVEAGELTPTMKLRRSIIEANYRDEIEGMYATG